MIAAAKTFGATGLVVVNAVSGTKNTAPPEPICSTERHGWYSNHQLRSPLSVGRSMNVMCGGSSSRGQACVARAIDEASACDCATASRRCAGMYASVAAGEMARRAIGPPKIVYVAGAAMQGSAEARGGGGVGRGG